MGSQTVLRLASQDGPDSIVAVEEPIPTVDKYEVLIKVRSIALNYRDVAIVNGKYPFPVRDQVIPCSDMAGEVVQVGDLVDGFSIGDAVLSPGDPTLLYGTFKSPRNTFGGLRDGVLKEYIALPAHGVIKLPKTSHSFIQWASMVSTGATIWNSFYGNKTLQPGQTVLLLGTGGVSMAALVFAKAAGATTIITSSSNDKLEYIKSKFGADYTVNYNECPNWAVEVQRITNGQGVDHIIENGGEGTIQQSLECITHGGIVSLVGYLSTLPADKMPNVVMLALVKAAVVRGILGGSKQQLEEAVHFMGSHNLQMAVDKTFAFNRDDVVTALKYVASGRHIGKVCITLD